MIMASWCCGVQKLHKAGYKSFSSIQRLVKLSVVVDRATENVHRLGL